MWSISQERMLTFIVAAAVAVGVASLLLILRAILFRLLHQWARKTQTDVDNIIVTALGMPSILWCIVGGLYSGIALASLPPRLSHSLEFVLTALLILSVTLATANILSRLTTRYAERALMAVPITGLSQALVKWVVLLLGLFILLNSMGISITPLLTALGVGGLAVALALQDTLSNFFAGLHILVEKPVRVGDYIKLQSGEEGYVEDIGWRTTRLRMLPNNMVIIPNGKLAQSIITNFYLPEKRMALLIPVSVSYDTDPEHVERVLIEEATKAAGEVQGLLPDPPPFVRFIPGFGDSSLDFTLICQVSEFTDQYLVQHELRKRIFKRFREEGIEIPFPQRVVHLRKAGSEQETIGGTGHKPYR